MKGMTLQRPVRSSVVCKAQASASQDPLLLRVARGEGELVDRL